MPRPKPAVKRDAAPLDYDERARAARLGYVTDAEINLLLTLAAVKPAKRADCIAEIDQQFHWYWLRRDADTEASQAESLRIVADAAREHAKSLAKLPIALRLEVEPDYTSLGPAISPDLRLARYEATAAAKAAADLHPDERGPDELAKQPTSQTEAAQQPVTRSRGDLLSRARAPLPLEVTLAAHIEATEKAQAAMENRVDGTWSKRRGILDRNELALQLKAIVVGFSPKLAKDERAAEDWVAVVLDTAKISHPNREMRPADFKKMFIPAIR